MKAAAEIQVDSLLPSAPDGSGQFHATPALASSDHQTERWVDPTADLGTLKRKVSSWNRTQDRPPGTVATILSYAGSYLYVKSLTKQMIIRKKWNQTVKNRLYN